MLRGAAEIQMGQLNRHRVGMVDRNFQLYREFYFSSLILDDEIESGVSVLTCQMLRKTRNRSNLYSLKHFQFLARSIQRQFYNVLC